MMKHSVSSGKMCFNTSPALELRHPNWHGSVVEKLLLTAASGRLPDKDCVDVGMKHARNDVNKASLLTQLELLAMGMSSCDHSSITDIRVFLLSLSLIGGITFLKFALCSRAFLFPLPLM